MLFFSLVEASFLAWNLRNFKSKLEIEFEMNGELNIKYKNVTIEVSFFLFPRLKYQFLDSVIHHDFDKIDGVNDNFEILNQNTILIHDLQITVFEKTVEFHSNGTFLVFWNNFRATVRFNEGIEALVHAANSMNMYSKMDENGIFIKIDNKTSYLFKPKQNLSEITICGSKIQQSFSGIIFKKMPSCKVKFFVNNEFTSFNEVFQFQFTEFEFRVLQLENTPNYVIHNKIDFFY